MRNLLLGIVLGGLALGLVRFAFSPWQQPPHYHANWAVFIDGERLDLSADRYMEDASVCVGGDEVQPNERVHMHENDHDVVHVHHRGVTWGHFLTNLGFVLGADYLITDDGRRLVPEEGRTLVFVVNGFAVPDVHNRLIRSGDRLLISYGPGTAEQVVATQFPGVASNAEEFNQRYDPAGCSGPAEPTFGERLLRAFWG